MSHRRGGTHSHSSEGRVGSSHQIGPQPVALAIPGDIHGAFLSEIAHQIGPGDTHPTLVQPALQVYLQPQGQETPHDMADAAVIGLVVDGFDLQGRLGLTKGCIQNGPQAAISPRGIPDTRDLRKKGGDQRGQSRARDRYPV